VRTGCDSEEAWRLTVLLLWRGIDLLGAGAQHRWPRLRGSKRLADFSQPDALGGRFACELSVPLAAGTLAAASVAGLSPARQIYLVRARGRFPTRTAEAFVSFARDAVA
jgi:hypothetical protein